MTDIFSFNFIVVFFYTISENQLALQLSQLRIVPGTAKSFAASGMRSICAQSSTSKTATPHTSQTGNDSTLPTYLKYHSQQHHVSSSRWRRSQRTVHTPSEADLPTDNRSVDVTLADDMG